MRRLGPRTGLVAGYSLGAAGYALGLAASAATDWPSGPAAVLALAALALAGGLVAAGRR